MNKKKINFLFLSMILIFTSRSAMAMEKHAGILLADDQGKILYSQNKDKQFSPASTLKILTSLAAIDCFGMNYRFKTLYTYDKVSKNLYIKGFGDPLFISEVIQDLCQQIVTKTNAGAVNNIILDHSFFHQNINIPGTGNSLKPYDATIGALCANFNTMSFKWDVLNKRYISAEPQTPLLPMFIKEIKASGQKQGRILLSPKQRKDYPGLLIKFFLEKQGVTVNGSVGQGQFYYTQDRTFTFQSPFTLEQVIQKLLKYSNNFMANQLTLTMGAVKKGPPATLEKGVKVLKAFGREKLELPDLIIKEGSGLSRKDRITPDNMLKMLMTFMPFHNLLKIEGNEYYKTGTLSDVRCRAGFIRGHNNRLYPFVIMINKINTGYADILRDLHNRVNMIKKAH
ncbi:MAG: D-alanyl-D-alanine carboxypeptidase [Desulfobacteraceae bacterium]|nr:D-alanyl-D-alanine carboxypeptidase [Desulfobacteraceae bacterium]